MIAGKNESQTVFIIGDALAALSRRQWAVLCLGLLGCIAAHPALAADCPGNRNALGTSRTLAVDPREHPRIGTMQYPETLPLRDHEVVLTFDDGPLPRNSNKILAILASHCVKATFFIIGRMAQAFPEGVRKLVEAGHSVGAHTQNHPLTMDQMPLDRARQEVDEGIAAVKSALGNSGPLAPFFRIPGLLRSEGLEEYLASQGIQIWSADFLADDWRHISPSRIHELAINRLEQKGKGILLLHDIQPRTVAALPRILSDLKARGYRIVHVVPATPENPATPTEPREWQMHPLPDNVTMSRWPKIAKFVFGAAGSLPMPAQSVFEIQEGLHAFAQGLKSPRRAEQPRSADLQGISDDAGSPRRTVRDKPGRGWRAAVLGNRQAAQRGRGTLRHLVLVRKRRA